ncbi:hypothetical protein ACEQ8H_007747 [Pleosporales sp. CAS-2024a]
MAQAAPYDVRDQIVFKGTPERGWYEPLDPDEYKFFTRGRVFAMLWSETAGSTASKRTDTDNTFFTQHPNSQLIEGKYGEQIYCSIRRFVVMRVNLAKHFVEAW